MSNNGWEIGSHGYDHYPFSGMKKSEIINNLVSSKKRIEDIIGKKIKSFSIPFNYYNPLLNEIIIEYGESISKIINKYAHDIDLIILGHRKQTNFRSRIMDSIDEGISNIAPCPVLVVQKN